MNIYICRYTKPILMFIYASFFIWIFIFTAGTSHLSYVSSTFSFPSEQLAGKSHKNIISNSNINNILSYELFLDKYDLLGTGKQQEDGSGTSPVISGTVSKCVFDYLEDNFQRQLEMKKELELPKSTEGFVTLPRDPDIGITNTKESPQGRILPPKGKTAKITSDEMGFIHSSNSQYHNDATTTTLEEIVTSPSTTSSLLYSNELSLKESVHVYMVHYSPLRSRRENITAHLQEGHDISPEWVLGFDKEVFTGDINNNSKEEGERMKRCFSPLNNEEFRASVFDGLLAKHRHMSDTSGNEHDTLEDKKEKKVNYGNETVVSFWDRVVRSSPFIYPNQQDHNQSESSFPYSRRKYFRHDIPKYNTVLEKFLPQYSYRTAIAMNPLKLSQLSVVIKHHSAIYDMVRNGYNMALILEDDALLRVGFKTKLGEVLRSIPPRRKGVFPSSKDTNTLYKKSNHATRKSDVTLESISKEFDVVWVGGCMRMHGYRRKFKTEKITNHLYEKAEARCAHAYLVSHQGGVKILKGLPATLPIDYQITSAMSEHIAEVRGDVIGLTTSNKNAYNNNDSNNKVSEVTERPLGWPIFKQGDDNTNTDIKNETINENYKYYSGERIFKNGENTFKSYWVEPWLSIQGDTGGCVTNDIGSNCVSVEKRYNPAFDIVNSPYYIARHNNNNNLNNERRVFVDHEWNVVPPHGSK